MILQRFKEMRMVNKFIAHGFHYTTILSKGMFKMKRTLKSLIIYFLNEFFFLYEVSSLSRRSRRDETKALPVFGFEIKFFKIFNDFPV